MPLGNVSVKGSRPTRQLSGNCAGSRALQVRDDRPQIGFGLRVGDAGLQPSEQVHVAHALDDRVPARSVIGR